MSVHLIRPLSALAMLALVACTGEDPEDAVPPTPAVEIGSGESDFEILSDGDEIQIIQGPQGGYHFNGSMRAWGVNAGNPDDLGDPSNPTTIFRVYDLDAAEAQVDDDVSYTQGLKDGGEAFTYQLVGRRVFLDIFQDDELDGHDVRLEVEFADADGNVLTDTRTLRAVPHPLNNTQY